MNSTNDTPRRTTTWNQVKVGDTEISQPPGNHTRKIVQVEPSLTHVLVTFEGDTKATWMQPDGPATIVDAR